jgi:hypothetical protein
VSTKDEPLLVYTGGDNVHALLLQKSAVPKAASGRAMNHDQIDIKISKGV